MFAAHSKPRAPLSDEQQERLINRRRKTNETARQRIGKPVRSVEHLAKLVNERRSVFHSGCWGLIPATCVMSMQARIVHHVITNGQLFTYNVPNKQ